MNICSPRGLSMNIYGKDYSGGLSHAPKLYNVADKHSSLVVLSVRAKEAIQHLHLGWLKILSSHAQIQLIVENLKSDF
jgi:hypothetical protein